MNGQSTFPRRRALLLLPALLALTTGILAGLARLGVATPALVAGWVGVHGALMTGGGFGTLIGLERAVALGKRWPYAAPSLSALATAVLLANPAATFAPWTMSAAALVMTLACSSVWWRQHAAHHAVLSAAAFAWLLGDLVWLEAGSVTPAAPLWLAFLILTIAGERLELSRFVPTPHYARRLFGAIALALLVSAGAAAWSDGALRGFAAALLLLALWLLRFDIARQTVRNHGLTRYMALCLLSGYGWLAVAGMLGLCGALTPGNAWRDAAVHALSLGFVFAMICGHAPVIGPALSRLKMRWHRGFYAPLWLLQASLALRIGGDGADLDSLRQWGALGNAWALGLFLLLVLESFLAARPDVRQDLGEREWL
jgi:hypothetical protein